MSRSFFALLIASIALVSLLVAGSSARAQMRVDGLSPEPPPQLLIFIVRGEGVLTPLVAFQERARAQVEAHMHVRVISMDETLAKGGAAFQKKLADCRGDPKCLSTLVGKVEAKYLLVLTASSVGELRIVGSRLIDLSTLTVLGEAVDEVPGDKNFLDVVPDRIHSSIPANLWDPFGALAIAVNQSGAQVRVNGRIVGMSPMAALGYLMPGDYKIEATKDGFITASALTKIERAKESKVDLALTEQPSGSSSSWLIWAGIGAAVIAGAVVVGAVALSSSSGDPTFCSAPHTDVCPR